MPNSFTPVYVHFVWATFDREPLILPEWETRLYAAIVTKCDELRASLMAVNGMADHIHVLLRLPATISLAEMAKYLKGASSHPINNEMRPPDKFQWQGAYYANSVSKSELDTVCAYIRNQKRHHSENTVEPDWERTEE
jgi:putative transposase